MGSFAIFVENIILTQPREIDPNFYYFIRLHPFPTLPPWGLQIYIDRGITIKINTDLIKLITGMFCFLESYVNIILTFPFRCVSPVKQEIKVNVTGYQSLNISNGVMSQPPPPPPPPPPLPTRI